MSEKQLYSAFGKAVSVRRKKLGLTQEELAGRVGLSRPSIANIENGRQNVSLHHVYKLASGLDFEELVDLLPPLQILSMTSGVKVPIRNDEAYTAREKALIGDLIASAQGSRAAAKAGS